MSTEPVTLMVARRVRDGRYHDLLAWLHEGEQLAADFPGYLGSGVLAPPPGDDEFQIVFRFADEQTLDVWEHSASRRAWLQRGSDLFGQPHEQRARGIDTWFGNNDSTPPPRWKQSVAIWLAFFPVSLLFNMLFGGVLSELGLVARILISTLALTPLMTYLFIPLSTRLLAPWLTAAPRPGLRPAKSAASAR
ncbi:antibiotic biosynthesis monooxygenase [Stutzerimonas zhaodongensis]|uniref:Antibiotic biosynthesis monooxygenase n=1 Tax=Stutzerimonas zhaodongensis TaxID=1176257 RepID=A0A3M2HMZ5_9GAMM|nr:antibiotic biosynthesis monooxygenase [Stutzerimonas zhaodongensis]MCQ2030767.1 antibiotic biosynthesis monooxygenase [Stutzerimonas zhaodongensis]MCQ4316421.1 antibiotic biosynthesis monooxygenase [Stutzerimonas zhaodongensis]RMH88940.1 antibiotic biosynthesis monooxygenase [Stutzerimonas zhaodongensis]